MFDLKNKRVLVVGGSSGIGEGIAIACANEGAKLMIASRSEDKLKAAAANIGHGVETDAQIFCCAHCAREFGKTGLIDRV